MDAVLVRLLETVARPIALALVHSVWQGGIIAGLVAAALVLLGRRSAAARYAVACVGLLAVLSTTVATGVWFARHPEPPTSPRVIWRRAVGAENAGGDLSISGPAGETAVGPEVASAPSVDGSARGGSASSRPGALRFAVPDIELAGPWVFSGWATGVLLLGGLHLIGWRRASALARFGTRAIPREWRERMRRLFRVVGLAESVRVLASTRVTVPTVVGWLRPVILIPASSFTELTASDLELVLIHELAHVRRHDVLINYIQAAAETLLFYHPAVWWISRRIRIEREHCCDDVAVGATGDGAAYARALSEVEHMRERTPAHAMAADGGAFRDRIRRLVGEAPSGVNPRRAGLAGVLVLTIVVGLSVPSLTAAPAGDASAKARESVSSRWDDIEGEWRAEAFGGQMRLHFDLPQWGECSMTLDDDSLDQAGDGVSRLERDAGAFILEGSRLPRKWRRAVFRPDAAYASAMEQLGYEIEKEEHLLELAIHDVTLDFGRGIADAGLDVSRGRLIEFRIHDATPEYVQAMADIGHDGLTPSKIIEFRIHGVEPKYVERMAAVGFEGLTPSRILEFRIHGIEPEYVERMAAVGYEQLTPERIVEFEIHGVEPRFIRELAEVGYGDLGPSRIVEFRIHGVDADFIRGLADHGITDVPPRKLVEYKLSGIPWEDLKKKGNTTRL